MTAAEQQAAARSSVLDQLDSEARRLWGAAIDRLTPDEYRDCLLCLALDRINALQPRACAGFAPPNRQRLALAWDRKQGSPQL